MESKEEYQQLIDSLKNYKLPRHVAIIMDGNGRWAQQRNQDRSNGHMEGISSVHKITQFSSKAGIEYLTLYAFSTENWNRPQKEVDTLMYLIGWAIERELPELIANNVKLRLVGDINRIPEGPRTILFNSVEKTAHCTGLTLLVCLSYSGRWEITNAAKNIARKCLNGEINPDEISEQLFSDFVDTACIPDPDLLIRTGGEKRISNFLLWQIAYSELYFSPTLWPDFDEHEYAKALMEYQNRERRFGKTGEQINK